MDRSRIHNQEPEPKTLSPCSSGRRRRISSDSNSPEFEFWMVSNPSFPQPNLLSADELFVNGFLLPLHLLPPKPPDPPQPDPEPSVPDPEPETGPGPQLTPTTTESTTTVLTASKRWTDIFKKGDKKAAAKNQEDKEKDKEKEKRREKKSQSGASSSAELNINIWPFSRSRSAGNSGTRPKMVSGAPGTRKVSSAPCSRSNSAGESKSRKWPSSPGRAGVHLGRSSPVWQVRRGGSGVKSFPPPEPPQVRSGEKGVSKKEVTDTRRGKTVGGGGGGGKAKVLNLNVPICIGYRHHLSCRSDENSAIGVGGSGGGGGSCNCTTNSGGGGGSGSHANNVGNGGNLFSLRSFFTKKVY